MKKAFTLAEIMIVLSVIGILAAILLPTAFHAAPDEKVAKFKKANSTLAVVLRDLVTSERYFTEGHLGTKFNGEAVSTPEYFCESFADMLATKSINCSSAAGTGTFLTALQGGSAPSTTEAGDVTLIQDQLDADCKDAQATVGAEIVAADGITWFQASPQTHFGTTVPVTVDEITVNYKRFASPMDTPPYYSDKDGFDVIYKAFCFDVDGLSEGEDPFGYGIRGDGKLVPGTRAQEWINKSIQNKNN